jgi:hypothetical protein
MKQSLLVTTAVALVIGTGALAQTPSDRTQAPNERSAAPSATQSQSNQNPPPALAPPSSAGSTSTTQNAPSAPANNRLETTTGQSAQTPNANSDGQRPQAQTGQPSPSNNNATTAPSQAQSAQPPASSSQAQTDTARPVNNQNQPAANSNAARANQPATNQANTAQPSSSKVNVSANLNDNQRTRLTESITRLNAKPVTNVNFSLSVGTIVPRDVHFQPLPADVVEIVPQYRGYNFFVVREDIVIVEPSTYKIVDVLPRSGRSAAAPASQPTAAAAPARKTSFSDNDREVIRKHARSYRTEDRRTTGSSTTTRVRVGDRLPDSVEIRSFPDEVYRDSPSLRDYRYIERDSRTYVVEPHERTIIEEIE